MAKEGWQSGQRLWTIVNSSPVLVNVQFQVLTGHTQCRIRWVLVVEGAIRIIVLIILPHVGRSCSDARSFEPYSRASMYRFTSEKPLVEVLAVIRQTAQ